MKREEDKTIIYQNKLMKQQMDEIENIYMTMRGWRHDYHNHLQSLKGYLSLNKVDQMKNYLNELETDLD
ncbi:MAG: Spo0B domain-containing protein, partial [Solobacterium sp.]|nr:Spo0B domain-containing protein [Solobacterium sp.]